jgi:glycosyltransferase involved in cell wall biosynthesis
MKVAQIAPLMEAVPPRLYGGTERIVSHLTEELVRQGHEVTLFASGDSTTSATLVPCCAEALRLNPAVKDPIPYHMGMIDTVARMADQFDVLHFHIDQFHFPSFRPLARRTLTTLHGRQDLPDLQYLYAKFPDMPLVSISDAQRRPVPAANFAATVYHGLPDVFLPFNAGPGSYLAFLGRISPEKRVDRAIHIAQAAGLPIKIAAKIDKVDEAYFESEIRHLFSLPGVEYIGEIGEHEKADFLGRARALLFPIDWPEPFGLVMIEAMACGTPVLAFRHGSVPEVIDDGVSGLVVDGLEEAITRLPELLALDRRCVRHRFEQRFHVSRMAESYLKVYQRHARMMGANQLRASSAALAPLQVESLH